MIVIDASIAVKLINPEEKTSLTDELLSSHLSKKEEIIVPSFLFIEVANALATKTIFTKLRIKEGLKFLYSSNFLSYEITQNDLMEASLLAKSHKTSVYDMLYAVIAKNKKIKLITADARFVKKVGFSYVKHLSDLGVEQLAPK